MNNFVNDTLTDSLNSTFKFQKNIEFKSICYGYSINKTLFKNLNLTINKGQTIGLIGESGSGKSTLVDLLIGLHEPNSGKILVDGNNLTNFIKPWRASLGYVSQTVYLLDDSIVNNIALGIEYKKIDFIKIIKIIKEVQLESFVSSLELGVETKVGERGVQLSGGQRQRIGIARALYNEPEVLILDEATSALDSETEAGIMNSINNFKGEKTIIIVAHRLTTLYLCDEIFEIVNGEILKK
jgi:ABC-type multidrug transport system fused ATPase/permease subunit